MCEVCTTKWRKELYAKSFLYMYHLRKVWHLIERTPTCTSSFKDSRSLSVLVRAITSAPLCARAFTVARPIPRQWQWQGSDAHKHYTMYFNPSVFTCMYVNTAQKVCIT